MSSLPGSLRQHLAAAWPQYLFLLTVSLFPWGWHAKVTGHVSPAALGFFLLLSAVILIYGRLVLRLAPLGTAAPPGSALEFVAGFLLFNALLFLLTVFSPLGIRANVLLLAALAVLCVLFYRRSIRRTSSLSNSLPELFSALICGIAATLWCADALDSIVVEGSTTIFRIWQDFSVHVRLISLFAHAFGPGTISDMQMAGSPMQMYHYAMYATPAATSSLTGTNAYEAYVGFLLPFSIVIAGLAAFCLAASLWGNWAGLAATVAIVLLPDAYQQGFANKYLSYNFFQQVAPGGFYGVACVAVAWIFILDGCRTGRYLSIFAGYVIVALSVVYKAHLFVANAFLIMIYPCLFFAALKGRTRLLIGACFVAVFLVTVVLSQRIGGLPTLRLDGSSAGAYALQLLHDYDPGVLGSFFRWGLVDGHFAKPVEALFAASMILLSTFGLWLFACPILCVLISKRTPAAVWMFPLLVIANYVVMSLGLAMDTHKLGTPDELLSRPLVWAYFAVAAWTAGALYWYVYGNGPPASVGGRVGLAFIVFCGFLGPVLFAKDLQTLPTRGIYGSFKTYNAYPSCLVDASRYVRDHGKPEDVIQDSTNGLLVSAFAERQAFVVDGGARIPNGAPQRMEEMGEFRTMSDPAALADFAAKRGISWYVLYPDSAVAWPDSFLANVAFACGGYRVFRFGK